MGKSQTPPHDCRSCRYLTLRRGVLDCPSFNSHSLFTKCQILISRFASFFIAVTPTTMAATTLGSKRVCKTAANAGWGRRRPAKLGLVSERARKRVNQAHSSFDSFHVPPPQLPGVELDRHSRLMDQARNPLDSFTLSAWRVEPTQRQSKQQRVRMV